MVTNSSVRHAVRCALATGVIVIFGAGSLVAHAQQAVPTPPQTQATKAKPQALQTIVVTGSLIERTNFQTPNPVQVLSSKTLVQSGFTDFTDVLKNISSNGQGTLGQSFSFAFASGGSGISLHGLTLGDTLVMIDGQRTVPYPLLDDNQRDFVDVSAFPMMAVKRVEVLSSGGSSLYGGDAIAGVVNVVLRKQYQGFKVMAETGQTEQRDATMEHVAFIGGKGDLDADGYNWYIAGDFRHQDQVLAANRHGMWDSLNFTQFGGNNLNPGAPASQNPFYPGGPGPFGEVPYTLNGVLVNPDQTNNLPPITYLPGCSANAQEASQCLIPNPRAQLQPPSTRVDLIGKYHLRLNGLPPGWGSWTLGVEASYFDSTSEQVGAVGGAFSHISTGYPNGFINFSVGPGIPFHAVPTFPLTITVPADYPGNPYGAPAPLVYPFPELGPGVTTTDTSTERLLASLTGHVAGWRIKATAGGEFSSMILREFSGLNGVAFQAALNNGYILGSPDGTSLFAPVMETKPTSQLDLINVNATHNVFHLWAGPIKGAIGVEWFKEAHDEHAPAACQAGLQACDPVFVIGTHKDTALYAELDTPIIKQFELDGTVRYDHYNQFGGSTSGNVSGLFNPLLGTRWNWVTLRANWGRSFRPPTAAEGIQSGETFGLGVIPDPTLCPNPSNADQGGNFPATCDTFPAFVINANPQLRNVHSTNWGGGIVLHPIRAASLSADYYNIRVENDIVLNPNVIGTFRNPTGTPLPYCPLPSSEVCTQSQLVTQTTSVGLLQAFLSDYINAGETHTSGIEFDLDAHYDAGRFGRFSGELHWTHLLTYQLTENGTTYELAGTHGPSAISGDTGNPKERATLQASWQKGPLTLTGNVYYTGSYNTIDPSDNQPTCNDSISFEGDFNGLAANTPTSFCTVDHFITTNFYGEYQLTTNFSVHASVENAFNRQPPVDFETYGSGSLFYPYNAAFAQAGALGRFWIIGATYTY